MGIEETHLEVLKKCSPELKKIVGRHPTLWNYSKLETMEKLADLISQAKQQGREEERERVANKLWSELIREGCRLGEDGGEPVTEKEFERLPRIAKVISSLTPQKEEND